MKDEFNSLRYELIDRQKIDQEGYYKMEKLLEHLHMTSRKFEDLFRESIDKQRYQEEILFKENRLLLEKIFTGQEILSDRIANLEKKISSY
jgi:ribosomal protein L16 Arg81 hydroxylase